MALALQATSEAGLSGTLVAATRGMLKLVGSYVIAKMLGFGLLGAVVIYALLTMLT